MQYIHNKTVTEKKYLTKLPCQNKLIFKYNYDLQVCNLPSDLWRNGRVSAWKPYGHRIDSALV